MKRYENFAGRWRNRSALRLLADVIVDGRLILKVRGATAFPAERRAAEMRQLIIAAAKDKSILPDAVILFFVTRYVLRIIRAFFQGIDSGAVKLRSFEQDWAWPTYRILRLVVVVFAFVMAYPHIPGSHFEAFKGISLLLGLLISLAASGCHLKPGRR